MIQEMRLKTEEIEQLRSDRRQDEMEGMAGSKGPQVRLRRSFSWLQTAVFYMLNNFFSPESYQYARKTVKQSFWKWGNRLHQLYYVKYSTVKCIIII